MEIIGDVKVAAQQVSDVASSMEMGDPSSDQNRAVPARIGTGLADLHVRLGMTFSSDVTQQELLALIQVLKSARQVVYRCLGLRNELLSNVGTIMLFRELIDSLTTYKLVHLKSYAPGEIAAGALISQLQPQAVDFLIKLNSLSAKLMEMTENWRHL